MFRQSLTKITGTNREGFAATEFNEIFSGSQPRQDGGLVWVQTTSTP
jgi:hypothetical protein